jgi:hypothetical protein
LVGCTFSPVLPSTEKIANSKVENPSFNIPPMNLKDYKDRNWILLAESTGNNWFYDPYSLNEDEEGIVTFDAFFGPRKTPSGLNRFNASIAGPFLQKIDCFSNHQWSEIFYADKMPPQETFVNSKNPNLVYGWIKIKPKSAMAYIRTRICGRKFLDDKNVNYFLFQEGQMKVIKIKASSSQKKLPPTPAELMVAEFTKSSQLDEVENFPAQNFPVFYEVINNAVTVVDAKKNVREMQVASYLLDREFPKIADHVFRANCETNTYSFSAKGKPSPMQELVNSPEALVNVAFDRVCGDHGNYMKSNKQVGR